MSVNFILLLTSLRKLSSHRCRLYIFIKNVTEKILLKERVRKIEKVNLSYLNVETVCNPTQEFKSRTIIIAQPYLLELQHSPDPYAVWLAYLLHYILPV